MRISAALGTRVLLRKDVIVILHEHDVICVHGFGDGCSSSVGHSSSMLGASYTLQHITDALVTYKHEQRSIRWLGGKHVSL